MQNKTIIVGLLGGIASGKSTIARLFKEIGKGVVINADQIGHQVLNQPAIIKKLVAYYGKAVLKESGKIDRCYLGDISFTSRQKIKALNKLVHPHIRQEIYKWIKSSQHRLIILDAALLLETGLSKLCNYLVFVNTPYRVRQQRVITERKWSKNELKQREQFQLPMRLKKEKADFIVQNTRSLAYARQQVFNIVRKLQKGDPL